MARRVDGVRVTFDEGEVLALFDCDAARADVVGRRDERALLEAAGDRKCVGGHGRRSPLDKCMSARFLSLRLVVLFVSATNSCFFAKLAGVARSTRTWHLRKWLFLL